MFGHMVWTVVFAKKSQLAERDAQIKWLMEAAAQAGVA